MTLVLIIRHHLYKLYYYHPAAFFPILKYRLTNTTTMTTITNKNNHFQRPLIVAAWVDQTIGEAGTHQYIKQRFESLSPFITQWTYFDCSDNFTDYITNNPNVKLISIMSGGISRLLVPTHSHLAALHTVYVFCADMERARESMADKIKVKGIFTIEDDLYDQMADDLAKLLVEEGIAYAQLDQRSVARLNYEEAKRLLSTQANRLKDEEKKERIEEIDARIDQLLA